jgi:hypothetical protein
MSQITRSTMFDPLLEADPSFQARWEAFIDEWGNEPEPPLYLALASLANHMADHLEAGRASTLDRTFEVVERWHVEGDAYVSEAATIGLLESLQGMGSGALKRMISGGIRSKDFEEWMRPETMRWWKKLDRFWDGNSRALRSDT